MKTILLINPYSKSGKSKQLAQQAIEYLKNNNFPVEIVFIKYFDEAIILSKKANQDGYDNIVVLGGDGTINNVINGFFDDKGNRISKSRFGVIYTGTSPDFCKSYGIPTKIKPACDTIIRGKSITIPVGMISYKLQSVRSANIPFLEKTSYFVCCANIGLGASLARNANAGIRKYFGDFAGTFVSLIKTLIQFKTSDINILSDNNATKLYDSLNISIGITKYIASGIKVITAQNKPDEFYIIKMRKAPLLRMIEVIYRIYTGNIDHNGNHLNIDYCRNIELSCNDSDIEVEFDGDPHGLMPCRVEFAKDKLNLIC